MHMGLLVYLTTKINDSKATVSSNKLRKLQWHFLVEERLHL